MKKQIQTRPKLPITTENFLRTLIHQNSIATNTSVLDEDFDPQAARRESEENLQALAPQGPLEAMLASQLLGINQLQHACMTFANNLTDHKASQYYTNSAIKLSNTFVQQATLLAKLQGWLGQKIIVERVEVNHGGQAIVGNIQGTNPAKDVKK